MTERNRCTFSSEIRMPLPESDIPVLEFEMLDTGGIVRKFMDVPYAGQSERQKVDIYLPNAGNGPFPAVLFLHGGAFFAGRRSDIQANLVIDGVNRGYAVVCVGHRLSGETQFPYPLFDVKAAIRFLRANAGDYHLDGDNFALAGDSAGSFYAIFAAATQGNHAFEDFTQGNAETPSNVKAVVNWYGDCDLPTLCHQWEQVPQIPKERKLPWEGNGHTIQNTMFGGYASKMPGLLFFANPLNFITADFPPIYIQHGTADRSVPVEQAHGLAEVVGNVCGEDRVTLEAVEDFIHLDPRFLQTEYQDRVFAFLDRHLRVGTRSSACGDGQEIQESAPQARTKEFCMVGKGGKK